MIRPGLRPGPGTEKFINFNLSGKFSILFIGQENSFRYLDWTSLFIGSLPHSTY
jgi:hypothetical protein